VRTVTIITTDPNDTMKPIHDRMPVIVPAEPWDQWLDPNNDDTESLAKLLVPALADLLVARPVSTAVNSTRNDGPTSSRRRLTTSSSGEMVAEGQQQRRRRRERPDQHHRHRTAAEATPRHG
jgi:SOS response associated peptidase (SRAP)